MNIAPKNRNTLGNSGLAEVAVKSSVDTFVVNQSLVLRINICGEIATFANPKTFRSKVKKTDSK